MKLAAPILALGAARPADAGPRLDNGFDRPPMGWSALYGAPFSSVNETIVEAAAAALNSSGLLAAGYKYVVLDDWYAERDASGKFIANPTTFPSGMPAVSDRVHSAGALFGIYSAASQRTCANRSASQFRETDDANVWANEWKIDYLKYDSCLFNNGVSSRARYTTMSRALNATGRKIWYSVEGWSPSQGDWGPEVANMWRTGGDIWPRWDKCILRNLYCNNFAAPYHSVGGGFNDPDMLQPPASVGGSTAQPGLTFWESQSQHVLWAIMKAPMMLGLHWSLIASLPGSDYFDLITNKELIAINQDLSPQATLVCSMPSWRQGEGDCDAIDVNLQQCDPSRCDQSFSMGAPRPTSSGAINLVDSNLCLATNASGSIVAVACGGPNTPTPPGWTLTKSGQFGRLSPTASPQSCAVPSKDGAAVTVGKCSYTGPLPPPLEANIGEELFVWDSHTGQIVSASSGQCLTVGKPNWVPTWGAYDYTTNNGTLEAEVWMGPLSNGKKVVVLFNKSPDLAIVDASPAVLGTASSTKPIPVRDLLSHQDSVLKPGTPLGDYVQPHGVKAYVLG